MKRLIIRSAAGLLIAVLCSASIRAQLDEPAADIGSITNDDARLAALQAVWPWGASSNDDTTAAAAASPGAAGGGDASAQQAPPPAPWPVIGVERAYVLPLLPLSKAPKPPTAFAPFNQAKRWSFIGGTGYLFVLKYSSNTPIGAYSELMYLPGHYRPKSCQSFRNTSALSVQRIWVDTQASMDAGRLNWGFPKELATFNWTNATRPGGPAAETVVVRVGKTVVLNATFTAASSAIPSWLFTPSVQADLRDPKLLWPLTATSLASPDKAVPNLGRVDITLVPTIASGSAPVLTINSRVLTGVAGLTVSRAPEAAVLVYRDGSAGLPLPSSLVC